MKKLYLISLMLVLVFSGCTPKSQLHNSAEDILQRVEATCAQISSSVEKLDDEYTTGVFENIKKSTEECKKILSDRPSREDIELTITSLSRLEKELGSIKILVSGMEDYTPEVDVDTTDSESEVETN